MGWSSIVGATYCAVFPCVVIVNVLAAVPWHFVLVPLGLLGRLEVGPCPVRALNHPRQTLCIYLSVAAVFGLLSGSILHVLAWSLVAFLDLRPSLPLRLGRASAPAHTKPLATMRN